MTSILIPLVSLIVVTLLSVVGQLLTVGDVYATTIQGNNTRNTRPRSISFRRINSDGKVEIPGLYDVQDGVITPIQGHLQFERLVLGLSAPIGDDQQLKGCSERRGDNIIAANATSSQNTTTDKVVTQACHQGISLSGHNGVRDQTISLVQFYMATCPDCQGFSPYFKRFAADIGTNWHKLITIYTVNCNDFLNIHLCQEENPKLIVPNVRWYAMPMIQSNSKRATSSNISFNYSKQYLNVAHRQFIEKQRRDLVSLRRATLRFFQLMLNELRSQATSLNSMNNSLVNEQNDTNKQGNENDLLLNELPIRWHLMEQVGKFHRSNGHSKGADNFQQFINDLNWRAKRCLKELTTSNSSSLKTIINFIIFEHNHQSFIGRTLVADWSNWICEPNLASLANNEEASRQSTILVHYTSDLSLLDKIKLINPLDLSIVNENSDCNSPQLFAFNSSAITSSSDAFRIDELGFELLARGCSGRSNAFGVVDNNLKKRATIPSPVRYKRHGHAQMQRPERLNQRASLQRYYTRSQPFKYASSMASGGRSRSLQRRSATATIHESTTSPKVPTDASWTNSTDSQRNLLQAEAENVNWTPEFVYPGEESLRFEFNKQIALKLGLVEWPGSPSGHPGELNQASRSIASSDTIKPKDDDLTLLMLTDYYKVLDEIVHVDLISKGKLDGHQMLANLCFLAQLIGKFPFQGNVHLSGLSSRQQAASPGSPISISRHYLELLHQNLTRQMELQLAGLKLNQLVGVKCHLNNYGTSLSLNGQSGPNKTAEFVNITQVLEGVEIQAKVLGQIQASIRTRHDVGLVASKHLKWQYCLGSSEYLRGHTCSLWILFHTLTVHEYLEARNIDWRQLQQPIGQPGAQQIHVTSIGAANETRSSLTDNRQPAATSASSEYKFQVDYSKPPRRKCDPMNPDLALLNSTSQQLFVNRTDLVLANVINFVRFYLPCTNCAAHFSCMVEHSPSLDFESYPEVDTASHLLWLWEAHNRVNERTRGTHSEDPGRPKHIFPVYEACPRCYLAQPEAGATFAGMRFNRPELVKFLVARYQRSAILNNKINIEDLYKKP